MKFLIVTFSLLISFPSSASRYGNIISVDQEELSEIYVGNTVIRGDGREVYYDMAGSLIIHDASRMTADQYDIGNWDICSSDDKYQGAGLLCFTIGENYEKRSYYGIRGIRVFKIKGKLHENLFSKKHQIKIIHGKSERMKTFSREIAKNKAEKRARAERAKLREFGGPNLLRCGLQVYGPDLCHEMLKAGTQGGLSVDTINSPACAAVILDALQIESTPGDYAIAGFTGMLDDITTYGKVAENDWEKAIGSFASIVSIGTKVGLMLQCLSN